MWLQLIYFSSFCWLFMTLRYFSLPRLVYQRVLLLAQIFGKIIEHFFLQVEERFVWLNVPLNKLSLLNFQCQEMHWATLQVKKQIQKLLLLYSQSLLKSASRHGCKQHKKCHLGMQALLCSLALWILLLPFLSLGHFLETLHKLLC